MSILENKVIGKLFDRDVDRAEAVEMGVAVGAFIAACIHGAIGNGGAGLVDLAIAAFGPPAMIIVREMKITGTI